MTASRKPVPRPVRKAKPTDGDWVACFDRNGKLIGICPPDAITPVNDANAADADDDGAAGSVAKQARSATPKPWRNLSPWERQQRVVDLRKGLAGPGLAADGDELAMRMGQTAYRVLKQIHSGRRTA